MKRFLRTIPLVLIAYFVGEIVWLRWQGRHPSQVNAVVVWSLVLAAVAWLFLEGRRLRSSVHFDEEREQSDRRDDQRENESEKHRLPPTPAS